MMTPKDLFERRKRRARQSIKQKSHGRLRLSVFRSGKNIYVQVIDDAKGVTLCAASSLDKELKGDLKTGADKAAGITEVVFDRGGYIYHGRVKALADAAREGGLSF